MNFLDFINTPAGIIIISSICISGILLLIIVLLKTLKSHNKLLSINYNKINKKNVNMSIDNLTQLLCSHKFFSSVKYKYVETDYDFTFPLYDMLLKHKVKDEDKLLVDFKITLANKFLSDCLFKYLNESTRLWIKSILEEVAKTPEKALTKENYIPESMYIIMQNLAHFSGETKKISENLRITFKGNVILGMPVEFVDCFCKMVNKDINTIQQSFSSIIYNTNNSWIDKTIEILDVYELALNYIKKGVDSTLVIMNGQMKRYVEQYRNDDENTKKE